VTLHFGRPDAVKSVADAVPLYGGREFESATRSTVPMLSLLMHAPELFDEIVRQLGFPGDYDLFLEYTVRPPKGRGKASHTDVMLRSGGHALAVEGKWTEPMYESVGKWLKAGRDQPNRTSAAATAVHPHLAYFLFKPSPDDRAARPHDILDKLAALWDRLGRPATFPFSVVEIEANPLDTYEPLRLLPKGEEATADAVSTALQDSKPLFSFTGFKCQRVGGKP
jgi:hypothetical protein